MARAGNSSFALFIVSILAVLFLADVGFAANDEQPENYVKFHIGRFAPTGDLKNEGYTPGEDVELLIGHYFGPSFVLEGGPMILHAEGAEKEPYHSIYMGRDITIGGWIIRAKLVHRAERSELYGSIGIGRHRATLEGYTFGPGGDYEVKDSLWGYHAVVGANYDFTPYWHVGLEGKYVNIPNLLDSIDITGYSAGLVLGLRF